MRAFTMVFTGVGAAACVAFGVAAGSASWVGIGALLALAVLWGADPEEGSRNDDR